jgi:hypothetical protein
MRRRWAFQDDDINRCIVSYSNGARAWVNRSKLGNRVELRPVEMRNALKYEVLLSPGNP